MGSVWVAVQEGLGRRVALKVMHPAFAADAGVAARFRREAEIAASFNHPGIVPVTDFGVHEGQPYLVMDLLEGESLDSLLSREGRLSAERVAFLATQILSALEAAHAKDVVHRDLKPDNVFVTSSSGVQDVARLLDFGIASLVEATGDAKMTSTGQVLGTPAYMAPEQAKGLPVERRSDLYSVGVIMYEALTGQVPFSGTNYHQLMFAIVDETPPPLAELRPDLEPSFVAVIDRAMSKKAEDRYDNAMAMRAAIAPFARSVPMTSGTPALASPQTAPANPSANGTDPMAATMASGDQVTPVATAVSVSGATEQRSGAPFMILGVVGALALVAAGSFVALRADPPEPGLALAPLAPTPAQVLAQVPADLAEPEPAEPAEPANPVEPNDTTHAAPDETVAELEESNDAPRMSSMGHEASRTGAPPSMSVHAPAATTNAGPNGGVMVPCGDDGYEHELFIVRPRHTVRATSATGNNNVRPVSELLARVNARGDAMARCYQGHMIVRGQLIELTLNDEGRVTRVAMNQRHGCPIPPSVERCIESTLRPLDFSDTEHRAGDVRVGLDYRNR